MSFAERPELPSVTVVVEVSWTHQGQDILQKGSGQTRTDAVTLTVSVLPMRVVIEEDDVVFGSGQCVKVLLLVATCVW